MKESVSKSTLVQNYVKECASIGKTIDLEKGKTVGNNGYVIGQSFDLDGTITLEKVTDTAGKTTAVYFALGTTDGTKLSLQSLMGLTSLRGYVLNGSDEDSTGNKYTAEVSEDVDANFSGWNVPTRDLYEFAAEIEANPTKYANMTATFKGTAYRVWTAKKAGKDLATGASYAKGAKRISGIKVWSVD